MKTTLMLTMSYDDLAGRVGAATVVGSPQGGSLIAPDTVRRLACDANVIPTVLGSRSEVLDQGRATRLATPGQLAALWLRDAGCTFPGCSTPAHWCDAHHLTHWADGGTSTLTNLALLCGRHHTIVHRDNLIGRVIASTGSAGNGSGTGSGTTTGAVPGSGATTGAVTGLGATTGAATGSGTTTGAVTGSGTTTGAVTWDLIPGSYRQHHAGTPPLAKRPPGDPPPADAPPADAPLAGAPLAGAPPSPITSGADPWADRGERADTRSPDQAGRHPAAPETDPPADTRRPSDPTSRDRQDSPAAVRETALAADPWFDSGPAA